MKETLDAISDFINRVGFPIAACCAMFYLTYKTLGDLQGMLATMKNALDDLTTMIARCHGKDDK